MIVDSALNPLLTVCFESQPVGVCHTLFPSLNPFMMNRHKKDKHMSESAFVGKDETRHD